MKTQLQFESVDDWRLALGLLPVTLRDSAENAVQYVLMNGTTGNFCLDFAGEIADTSVLRATAWSCDVGHYVTCGGDFITVNRWGAGAVQEKYSRTSVVSQIHEFHRHLEKSSTDRAQSIVAHVLRIFRRFRTIDSDGLRALRALLHILASCAAGQDRLREADFELWGLAPETAEITRSISDATWRPLFHDLCGTGRYEILRPDFGLLVRHASGAVFQEAHLEVERPANLYLEGLEGEATIDRKAAPNEVGAYFTPPALARSLAEEATRASGTYGGSVFIFDPACGSGELLKECVRQLKVRTDVRSIRVVGWDKSPAAVAMARFVLAWEGRSWLPGVLQVEVSQNDSVTAENWPDGVDILLMNPPFKSWNLMSEEEQRLSREYLGLSYKPNLAMVFAHRALSALGPTGTLAMVAPNSLLEGVSGKHLRDELAELLSPRLVAHLGDQNIFARALVDAGIYVGTRSSAENALTAILWADSSPHSINHALRGLRRWRGAEVDPLSAPGYSVYRRDDVGRSGAPWIARRYESWRSYEAVRNNKRMVAAKKLFDVKQGVRTGNDAFIVTRAYYEKLPERERRYFRPAVMNPSISDGVLNDNYYVFYPHTVGVPAIAEEQDFRDRLPTYYRDRLLPAQAKLSARRTLVRGGQSWWELLEHRAWQEVCEPKIVSKYFGGSRSFAFDQRGQFVVVVGNAWLIEKGAVSLAITDDEVYLAVLTYLNSSITESLLKYVSIQVSGGQADLTKKYVANLPIPNLAKLKPSEVDSLVQTGKAICDGAVENWADVDELVLTILEG